MRRKVDLKRLMNKTDPAKTCQISVGSFAYQNSLLNHFQYSSLKNTLFCSSLLGE
ncbi:putative uncharacterized protein [Parachlamydia acanthamoebae UV-7]|uniref:Uncharacterized protein n=1 Tax=Parachlamydia acanthamoebae (strain UV7) TaxID=765952 RepID=F8KXG9_PARAV|nr:hypothetical protein pah_c197o028 [Parachlamydia acanthamoebae str. Hall's coccus]CCB87032.1 putative uncharacterized protein [Parachlamydia acanthamoebae UV-7]